LVHPVRTYLHTISFFLSFAGAAIVVLAGIIFYIIGPHSWGFVYVAAACLGLGKKKGSSWHVGGWHKGRRDE